MLEIFSYSFMIRAFLAGMMIAVIAPAIGNFLVVRRFSLIADTLSHLALSGVAIGLLLHTQPIITTVIVTIIAALAIEKIRTSKNLPGEAVLAMFLPGGLALSIVLISIANGFNANLFSYLFGSITTVTSVDLWVILALGIITLSLLLVFYRKLLFAAFDEESAKVSGINVSLINIILIVLTAVTVSVSMRVVGILLIGALMVIPVVTAMQIAKSFFQTVLYSIVFSLLAVVIGLFTSYYLDLPAGGVIVLFSLAMFSVIAFFKK